MTSVPERLYRIPNPIPCHCRHPYVIDSAQFPVNRQRVAYRMVCGSKAAGGVVRIKNICQPPPRTS